MPEFPGQNRGKTQRCGDARTQSDRRDPEQQPHGQRAILRVEPERIPHRYVRTPN